MAVSERLVPFPPPIANPAHQTKMDPKGRTAPFEPAGDHSGWISRCLALWVRLDIMVALVMVAWATGLYWSQGAQLDSFYLGAAGHWMIAHHRIISHQLGYWSLPASSPWHTVEWGYALFLAVCLNLIGQAGYLLAAVLPVTVVVALFLVILSRTHLGETYRALLIAYLGLGLVFGLDARPQVVAYVCFATCALISDRLVRLAATPSSLRSQILTVIGFGMVMVVWTNDHSSWPLGFVLLGVGAWSARSNRASQYPNEPTDSSRPNRYGPLRTVLGLPGLFWIAAVVGLVPTLVSPLGWAGPWLDGLGIGTQSAMRNDLLEWESPNFHFFLMWLIFAPLLVWMALSMTQPSRFSALKLPLQRLRPSFPDATLVVVMFALGLYARLIVTFMVMAAVWVVSHLPFDPSKDRPSRPTGFHVAAHFMVTIVLCLALSAGVWSRPPGAPSATTPVSATNFLIAHHVHRVFTTYGWGDYEISRGIQVYIDGAADIYGRTNLFTTYIDIANSGIAPASRPAGTSKNTTRNDLSTLPTTIPAWLAAHNIEWVLFSPKSPVSAELELSDRWHLAYRDRLALVFQHN
jgi:hypothetical protein